MGDIKIFEKEEFGSIKVIDIDSEPYFVGKDVAKILGYANPAEAIKEHIDCDDRKVLTFKAYGKTLQASLWQGNDFSNKTLINESGVYSLILTSKLPAAKQFKHWITSEVLPSIRKTGAYNVPQTFAQALRLAAEQAEKIEEQQKIIELQKPKADYFDYLVDRQLLTNFRDTAKEFGIQQKEFIDTLLKEGYIYRDKKGNIKPYAKYTPELFEIKDYKSLSGNHVGTQTLITPKGKVTFSLLIKPLLNQF